MAKKTVRSYRTITGREIPLSRLSKKEKKFLAVVKKKYQGRPDWTQFAAWWNAEFTRSGLSSGTPAYRICQDLEARLGINQGTLSPPDYRDFLADLIEAKFGTRQEFCRATGVDPGQLSRVFAGRADLSIRALEKVLEVLHARLVIQTDQEVFERTRVSQAAKALAMAAD